MQHVTMPNNKYLSITMNIGKLIKLTSNLQLTVDHVSREFDNKDSYRLRTEAACRP